MSTMTDRLFAILEENIGGAELDLFGLGVDEPEAAVAAALTEGIAAGVFERWPVWPARYRATGRATTPLLQELADLRTRATPLLARTSDASGWPSTLHMLAPGAHCVVERWPWDSPAEELAQEQKHYASPRSLRGGATAMAIVAHMPALQQAAFLDRHALQDWAPLLEEVRADGFCLRPSKDLAGGWVLSAPLRDADGLPYGALCTYGFCNALPEDFETKAAHTIREAALELSRWPYPALAARARRILAEAAA